MKKRKADSLEEFNQLYKKMKEIYHLYAKSLGISDMAFWLLYSLHESSSIRTQRDFCATWHYPPQTVNSAIKNLERLGLITLEYAAGNQKNKRIVPTKLGREYMKKVITPLVAAERRVFESLEDGQREALLSLTQKYVDLLETEAEGLLTCAAESSEGTFYPN